MARGARRAEPPTLLHPHRHRARAHRFQSLAPGAKREPLGVKLSEHVPASMILHFWKFVLRPATTDLGRDVGAIESFLEGHGDRVKELQDALEKSGGNQGPIATGLGPLLGTVRSLDLLHGFVLALPVSVDFLGIYARRAREAIEEARVDGGAS